MTLIGGHEGVVKMGSGTAQKVGYIDSWNLSLNRGTVETNQIGNDFKEFMPTTKDWSGSFSGSYDTSDAQQKEILDTFLAGGKGTVMALSLALTSGCIYNGNAIATTVSLAGSHGDKVTISVNFQGTGELTLSNT